MYFFHWPVTTANLEAFSLWAQSEGMPANAHNWLAISTYTKGASAPPYPYSEPFYDTIWDGASATAQFLTGSNYDAVRLAFQDGNSLLNTYAAINASPWCAGCQTGHYPIALWDYLAGDAATVRTVPPPITTKATAGTATVDGYMAQWWAELAAFVEIGAQEWYTEIRRAEQIMGAI